MAHIVNINLNDYDLNIINLFFYDENMSPLFSRCLYLQALYRFYGNNLPPIIDIMIPSEHFPTPELCCELFLELNKVNVNTQSLIYHSRIEHLLRFADFFAIDFITDVLNEHFVNSSDYDSAHYFICLIDVFGELSDEVDVFKYLYYSEHPFKRLYYTMLS